MEQLLFWQRAKPYTKGVACEALGPRRCTREVLGTWLSELAGLTWGQGTESNHVCFLGENRASLWRQGDDSYGLCLVLSVFKDHDWKLQKGCFLFSFGNNDPPPRHVSSRPQREGPGTLWHWEIVKLIGVRGQCGTSIRGHERCTS